MKIPVFLFLFALLLCPRAVFSQEQSDRLPGNIWSGGPWAEEKNIVPLSTLFYNIGQNTLHSLFFNYGVNFAAAGLGTWLFVESGVDWTWRNFAYKHETFANAAYSSVIYAGYVVPAATPVALYMAGIFRHDEKMQIAGLALGQSMILANAFHTILKLSTGRTEPYIINQYHHNRIDTSGDFSGEFDWFKMDIVDGWPSGHTLSAFATAATISEIYNDKTWVKIAAYSYAVLVGAGVSFNVHWASDVLAGALIGYAVGATVGRSFRQLLKPVEQHNGVSLSMTAYPLGISMRW